MPTGDSLTTYNLEIGKEYPWTKEHPDTVHLVSVIQSLSDTKVDVIDNEVEGFVSDKGDLGVKVAYEKDGYGFVPPYRNYKFFEFVEHVDWDRV